MEKFSRKGKCDPAVVEKRITEIRKDRNRNKRLERIERRKKRQHEK